jgi:hypothetical protein
MKKQERKENKKRKIIAFANLIASNEMDGKSKKPKRENAEITPEFEGNSFASNKIDGKSKKPKRKHEEISSDSEEKVASTSSDLVRPMKSFESFEFPNKCYFRSMKNQKPRR